MIPRDRPGLTPRQRRSGKGFEVDAELLRDGLSGPVQEESAEGPLDCGSRCRPDLDAFGWPLPMESSIKIWVGYGEGMKQKVACAPGYGLSVMEWPRRDKIGGRRRIGRKHKSPDSPLE